MNIIKYIKKSINKNFRFEIKINKEYDRLTAFKKDKNISVKKLGGSYLAIGDTTNYTYKKFTNKIEADKFTEELNKNKRDCKLD